MTDLDYYGYAPLIHPDRPLCVVGLPASHHGTTARLVSSFTGLPFFWLDRAVEHRAGASIDSICVERGDDARQRLESEVLPPVLERPSPHVIVLSEVSLSNPALHDLIFERTKVVFAQRSLDEVVGTIEASFERRPTAYARLLLGSPPNPGPLKRELQAYEEPMHRAHLILEATGLHPQHAAQAMLDALGWKLPEVWTRPD